MRVEANGWTISRHIRANVIGYLALFIALSGTAWAGTKIGSNDIKDAAVRQKHIAAGAVGSSEVDNDAIQGKHIGGGQVGASDIAAGAVGSSDVDKNAIQGKHIGGGQVGASNIAAGAVGSSEVGNDAIEGKHIGGGQVGASDIAAGAVGSGQIQTGAVNGSHIDKAAIAEDNLAFDAVTQAELNSHKSSADHDGRYFTESELSVSDGSAPNTGPGNRVHWDNLIGMPLGFVDGTDDTGGGGSDAWLLDGNLGTNPVTNFLGTIDNQPLIMRVNNVEAFRLQPATDGTSQRPNVIGGVGSFVSPGAHSVTIGGGTNNTVFAARTTIGGGFSNTASDISATVAGGESNDATQDRATVGGGQNNTADGFDATVSGGNGNTAGDQRATVGGGLTNTAGGGGATVGGGSSNTADGAQATIAGGRLNTASVLAATVGGGSNNTASANSATVAGGSNNVASGDQAAVLGGSANVAAGDNSFVAGQRAKNTDANHDGVFLFADSSAFDFDSAAANEFAVRSTGGARFVSAIDGTTGAPTAGVTLAPGGGSWASLSDRASKTAIEPISGGAVLDKLAELPVTTWSYEAQGSDVRHIGPMAQDFARAFGVGEDSRHITSIDADGVALAAIKGLNERVDELRGDAPESSLPPAALAGIGALALTLAAALGAALALRWSGRLGGRLAAS